ncbi:MAG TPA: pyrroloquinoline quinone-dependent dehydrogenase [Bryobacteraceae bacterium]|nr:pyrroloquinoline quinone-dependent dehydrogenase [Bryobacteraceae bacterium]
MRTLAFLLGFALCVSGASRSEDSGWPVYGHDAGGTKYSPLAEINLKNVQHLKVAWTLHTKDMYDPKGHGGRKSAFECTPLFIDGTLYVTTAFGRILAVDPDTGAEKWSFDPHSTINAGFGDFANRGAAAWVDSKTGHRRLFVATIDARLFAVDAATGKLIDGFGKGGFVNLAEGLRNAPHSKSEYEETSPPAVIGDLVITGSGIADNNRTDAASGEVRAFDARTGKLVWTFDPMPGGKTGAANTWSIISVDPERKLVFLPTGSASPDYYGGERLGDNLYANSLVALHAETGKIAWHFQTVHHDLWDYDVASQPTLFTWVHDGKRIPAIAVGSKTGNLFLLNRETGKPLFGVEERPAPASDVPGEKASPTQPFPVLPKPLVPQQLSKSDVWGATEEDRKWCEDFFEGKRAEGIFTPPSVQGSIVFPGNIGGMAWGGASFDPENHLLIIPTNRLAAIIYLIPRDKFDAEENTKPGYEYARQRGTPYGLARTFLLNPKKIPCNAPPWGTLTAIDVNSGEKKWETPLGVLPWLEGKPGAEKFGSPSLGGAIVTGGGLAFIGATFDGYFRAFEVQTGAEVWKAKLPTGARATPMTYRTAKGKQYVVIAAGGFEGVGSPQDDSLVAFSLP